MLVWSPPVLLLIIICLYDGDVQKSQIWRYKAPFWDVILTLVNWLQKVIFQPNPISKNYLTYLENKVPIAHLFLL